MLALGNSGCMKPHEHPVWECPSALRRFWSHVDRGVDDACWAWGGRLSWNRYGAIKAHGRHYPAQVLSWVLFHREEFPAGLEGCHSCDNPRCVNPHHVWPGTHAQNMADARAKGRQVGSYAPASAALRALTHCAQGHEFTPENTYISAGKGWRSCRQCKIQRLRAKRLRKKLDGTRADIGCKHRRLA